MYFYIEVIPFWNFSSIPKKGCHIHKFANRRWVLTTCTEGILGISMYLQVGKFQQRLNHPNIKYIGSFHEVLYKFWEKWSFFSTPISLKYSVWAMLSL